MRSARREHGAPATPAAVPLVALIAVLLSGCGSKISEANYYRVQNGMDEETVEDLLGPARTETTESEPATQSSSTKQALARKTKVWSRGSLTLSVVFEGGRVITRTAQGIPFEGTPVGHSVNTTPR